jgi:hypothetical protein
MEKRDKYAHVKEQFKDAIRKKVYCSECEYCWFTKNTILCHAPGNTRDTYFAPSWEQIKEPHEKNNDNHCELFSEGTPVSMSDWFINQAIKKKEE